VASGGVGVDHTTSGRERSRRDPRVRGTNMTNEELETIAVVACELIEFTNREIDKTNSFMNDILLKWLHITKKQAETTLWLCDELQDARGEK
jgi:hypothetical protein